MNVSSNDENIEHEKSKHKNEDLIPYDKYRNAYNFNYMNVGLTHLKWETGVDIGAIELEVYCLFNKILPICVTLIPQRKIERDMTL